MKKECDRFPLNGTLIDKPSIDSRGNEYVYSYVDEGIPFVKFYFDNFLTSCIDNNISLSCIDLKIIKYLLKRLEYNENDVTLVPSKILDNTDINSRNKIYDSINKLIKIGVIEKVEDEPYRYFVNHTMFVKGSTETLYKTHKK